MFLGWFTPFEQKSSPLAETREFTREWVNIGVNFSKLGFMRRIAENEPGFHLQHLEKYLETFGSPTECAYLKSSRFRVLARLREQFSIWLQTWVHRGGSVWCRFVALLVASISRRTGGRCYVTSAKKESSRGIAREVKQGGFTWVNFSEIVRGRARRVRDGKFVLRDNVEGILWKFGLIKVSGYKLRSIAVKVEVWVHHIPVPYLTGPHLYEHFAPWLNNCVHATGCRCSKLKHCHNFGGGGLVKQGFYLFVHLPSQYCKCSIHSFPVNESGFG